MDLFKDYLEERLKADPNTAIQNIEGIQHFGRVDIDLEDYRNDERIPIGRLGIWLCGVPDHGNVKFKSFRWEEDLEQSKQTYFNKWRRSNA